ncbi:MAG: hypothetical protein WEC37_04100 [Anaerolineales bacterium]
MARQTKNPPISTVLKVFTAVEFLVLVSVSSVLFFLPGFAASNWAWEIAPFNMRFLGAVYFASAVAVGLMLFKGRWAPARVILPMLLTFTGIALLISLMQSSVFLFDRPFTWGWYFIYSVLPINALAHILLYRSLPPADSKTTPARLGTVSLLVSIVLGVYGLAQLFMPVASSSFWPWPVNAFHAQLYSGIFFTAAVGLFLIRKAAAPIELASVGYTLAVLGFFAIVGLALTNAQVQRVNWAAPGTWLWMAGFAVIFLQGLGLILQSRKS